MRINRNFPLFAAGLVLSAFLFTACNEGETSTSTDKKPTAADSAAISPMDTRDTGRIDTTGNTKP